MIFLKGLFNSKNIFNYLFNIIIVFIILSVLSIITYKIEIKIDTEINKVEYRTAIVNAKVHDYIINKYIKYIDKYEINGDVIEIVFKNVKFLEKFILDESSNSNINDISVEIGKSMDTYKIVLFLLKSILLIVYIILFIMIFIFNIDYLNKLVYEYKLYLYLGYKSKLLNYYFLLFFIIFYSLIYLVFILFVYLLTNLFAFNIVIFICIVLVNAFSILYFNYLIKKGLH